jgi:hypothetical protein
LGSRRRPANAAAGRAYRRRIRRLCQPRRRRLVSRAVRFLSISHADDINYFRTAPVESEPAADDAAGRARHSRGATMVSRLDCSAGRSSVSLEDKPALIEIGDLLSSQVIGELSRRASAPSPGYAYVTVATAEYEWGLRVLLRSLRRHTAAPIVVLTTQQWDFACDDALVVFAEVPTIKNGHRYNRPEFAHVMTKLWAFALTGFARLTYIDADSVVLGSLDDLFKMEGFWASSDHVENAKSARFNSGLMSFSPSEAMFENIVTRASTVGSSDGGDQGLLNSLFHGAARLLPPEYSLLRHFHYFGDLGDRIERVRSIHYIVKKPWELRSREPIDAALTHLDDLWTRHLTHDELLKLVSAWRRSQFIGMSDMRSDSVRRLRRRIRVIGVVAGVCAVVSLATAVTVLSLLLSR